MLNKEKLKNIKLFLVDVDGVMTDGGIYYFDNGLRARKYHMHDGRFNALDKDMGIKSGFCTTENDQSIILRAEKLGLLEYSIIGSKDKLADTEKLLRRNNWQFDNLIYVGDDLNDIPLLKKAAISFAVNNAILEVKKIADYTTIKNGGDGAVREVIQWIYEKYTKGL